MGLINKALEYLGYGDPPAREGYSYAVIVIDNYGPPVQSYDIEYFENNKDYRLINIYSIPTETIYCYEFIGTPP